MDPVTKAQGYTAGTKHITSATDDVQLQAFHRRVEIGTDVDEITITLPPACDAPGQIVHLFCADVSAGGDTTVATVTGQGLASDLTIDADGDYAILYSDGVEWLVLVDGIASE